MNKYEFRLRRTVINSWPTLRYALRGPGLSLLFWHPLPLSCWCIRKPPRIRHDDSTMSFGKIKRQQLGACKVGEMSHKSLFLALKRVQTLLPATKTGTFTKERKKKSLRISLNLFLITWQKVELRTRVDPKARYSDHQPNQGRQPINFLPVLALTMPP